MRKWNKLERRQKGIAKARRVLRVWRASFGNDEYYADGGECERMLRKTRKPCSCRMCGNPRKMGVVTIQEKKQERIENGSLRFGVERF